MKVEPGEPQEKQEETKQEPEEQKSTEKDEKPVVVYLYTDERPWSAGMPGERPFPCHLCVFSSFKVCFYVFGPVVTLDNKEVNVKVI